MELEQLCLFSAAEMKRQERPQKPKKKRNDPRRLTDEEIAISAMQACMNDGRYDGPETAAELCYIFGFI